MGRVRSRWEKTARSPGAAGAGGRRRRRPAGPLCAARVRARAKAARSWVSLGLGSKRITRRPGDDEHLRVAGVVVAGLDEPLALEGDGRQKFFLLRTRTSERQRAEGQNVRERDLWPRAPGRPERASPREATSAPGAGGSAASEPQVCPSTSPPSWTCSCPTSPGRLGVPRATRATRWPPPRRRRPARPAAAPSPGPSSPGPEAPKQCKHVSLPCLGSESYPSPVDQRRRTKTPLKRLQIQFGFGAWKINISVDHIPP